MTPLFIAIATALGGIVIGGGAGVAFQKQFTQKRIKDADSKQKEELLKAKEEALKIKEDAKKDEERLKNIPGVLEVGIFTKCDLLILGKEKGFEEIKNCPAVF